MKRRQFLTVTGGLAGILGGGPRARLRPGARSSTSSGGTTSSRGRRGAQAPGRGGGEGPRGRDHLRVRRDERPPAPDHGVAPVRLGRRRHHDAVGLAPALREQPRRTSRTWPSRSGAAQGGFYDVWNATAKVGGAWLAVPHSMGGYVANYRRSWHAEIGVKEFAEDVGGVAGDRQEDEGEGEAGGAVPGPGARSRDLLVSADVELRRGRGGRERQEGRHQLEGHARVGEVPAGVLEGRVRRGRARLGRHRQQPRVPRRGAELDRQRALDLHRRQAPAGQAEGREGRAALPGHRARVPAEGAGPPGPPQHAFPARDPEVLEEPEACQGLPPLAPPAGELREVVHGQRGVQHGGQPRPGRTTRCGPRSTSRSRSCGRWSG